MIFKKLYAGYFSSGFTISGSQLYMKYLIIENAGLNGILISGSNNVLEHIITRYNSYSGIQISNYATSNKLSYCYSYRNINFISGSMYYGYGFYLQMPGPDNIFNYCFSWDNSNDGWINVIDDDSYDILHSASWNNGNPDVFTGKYDYDNRKSLDKNLWTIQHLIDSDPNFENNYKKRKFNIENGKILGKDAISWYNTFISESRGNGFNFVTRIPRKNKYINLDYTLSFDNNLNGFNNIENEEKRRFYIYNCVSFNNQYNYNIYNKISNVFWKNNWSWNPIRDHLLYPSSSLNFQYPTNDEILLNRLFYMTRDRIIKNCANNQFDDYDNFDSDIKDID